LHLVPALTPLTSHPPSLCPLNHLYPSLTCHSGFDSRLSLTTGHVLSFTYHLGSPRDSQLSDPPHRLTRSISPSLEESRTMRLPLLLLPLALSLGKTFAQSPSPSTGPSPSASIGSVAASPSPSPPASPSASPSASEAGAASPSPSASPSPAASPSSNASVGPVSTFDVSQTQTTLPVVATEATTVVPVVPQGASTGSPAGAASPSPSASSAAPPAGGGGGVNGGAPPVRDPNQRFNYPQPPLPSVSATRNSNSWILSPKFKITNKPVSCCALTHTTQRSRGSLDTWSTCSPCPPPPACSS